MNGLLRRLAPRLKTVIGGVGEVRFTQPSGDNSIRQTLGEFLLFRVPIRASYVMRMQWDRNG